MTKYEEAVGLADKHSTGSQLFKGGLCWTFNTKDIVDLIADVRRDERETCAQECDAVAQHFGYVSDESDDVVGQISGADMEHGAKQCASAIRAKLEEGK